MIDFTSARKLVLEASASIDTEEVDLNSAIGRVLAQDIISNYDHPFFDQSAVDGYLLNHAERHQALRLVDEIPAGGYAKRQLKAGEAMRIFTGAPVPDCGDTVVMQEYVTAFQKEEVHFIEIHDKKLRQGGNIRKQGGQLKRGATTLKKGSLITPAGIGFLASIGVRKIKVYRKLKVGIIVTGNEFTDSREKLTTGKIYESNGIMLQAALGKLGIISSYLIALDNLETLQEVIKKQSEINDILLITGGVSVGDYDFTRPALEHNEFKVLFHKVAQKPGKPILFMKRTDGKLAFGLPGNPRSALVCYYAYVLPNILATTYNNHTSLVTISVPLSHDLTKKEDGKTHLLSGTIENGQLWINKQQSSHMMLSMAASNVIAILPSNQLQYTIGDLIQCQLIPTI